MAQVDFSSAVLTKPNTSAWSTANLKLNDNALKDANNNLIASPTITRTNTATRLTHNYSGSFTASGTEFYIGNLSGWYVSGISFSAGDTFNFAIDIDITVV